MILDINHYNATFLQDPGQNDATDYGVKIAYYTQGGDITPFSCIGIHHLTPDENAGNHHVFIDVLDEQGQRIQQAQIEWTWIGRQLDEPAPPVTIDKPPTEPGTNIPMNWAQTVSLFIKGQPSDTVLNLHTRHPDEGTGNTRGHHSFYVVFQRKPAHTQPPPPNADCEQYLVRIAELDAVIDVTASKLQDVITMLKDA